MIQKGKKKYTGDKDYPDYLITALTKFMVDECLTAIEMANRFGYSWQFWSGKKIQFTQNEGFITLKNCQKKESDKLVIELEKQIKLLRLERDKFQQIALIAVGNHRM